MARMDGEFLERLQGALLSAFDRAELKQFVTYRMTQGLLNDLDFAAPLRGTVFDLIQWSLRKGQLDVLIRQARDYNSGNPDLQSFVALYEQRLELTPERELERLVKNAAVPMDTGLFLRRVAELQRRVCRIEFPAKRAQGTGFLVANDMLLTAYHVIEKVKTGLYRPDEVTLRFDYNRMQNGVTVNEGTLFGLDAAHWLLEESPYSPLDTFKDTSGQEPGLDALDYALLRVAGMPGQQAAPDGVLRGHEILPREAHDFHQDQILYIVQHPAGDPMQVAAGPVSLPPVNQSRTRIWYKVGTRGGASGAPCFNSHWDLVGHHHAGEPETGFQDRVNYNQGVPLSALLQQSPILKTQAHSA